MADVEIDTNVKDFTNRINFGIIVCTSGTRPTAVDGKAIYETDTDKFLIYNGATWEEVGGGGGDFYADGSVPMTGNLLINKSNPYIYLKPTDATSPAVLLKDSADNIKGRMYTTGDDMVVRPDDGNLYLSTTVTTGGNVLLETKGVTRLTVADAVLTSTVPLAMGSNKITGLAAASTNGDAVRYEQLAGLYLPMAGGTLTGDLAINDTTPHLVLQEGGTLRGSLYIESDDSMVLDAAEDNLSLVSATGEIGFFPAGNLKVKFTATDTISYNDVVIDTTQPGFLLYESSDYRGGMYIDSNDSTTIDSEHGKVILGTYASTGGTIDLNPQAAGVVMSVSTTGIDLNSKDITEVNEIKGTTGTSLINDFRGDGAHKIWFNGTTPNDLEYLTFAEHNFKVGTSPGTSVLKIDSDEIAMTTGNKVTMNGVGGGTYIKDDASGNMELHVATGKTVKIVVG